MSDTEYAPEPPIGSIVTDNGKGWPWIRTVGGNWTRDACATFLTWAEVHEWHQRAVDDPDDDTTEPFKPVVMVPALATTGGETVETVNGLSVHDWQKIASAKDEANAAAVAAIDELADAIRLTVEYVGNDTLPPIEGWSWFDALMKYRPELAEEFERNPILLYAKHLGVPVDPTSPETTEGQS